MIFKNRCVLVLWTKVASALEGLNNFVFNKHTYIHTFIHKYTHSYSNDHVCHSVCVLVIHGPNVLTFSLRFCIRVFSSDNDDDLYFKKVTQSNNIGLIENSRNIHLTVP